VPWVLLAAAIAAELVGTLRLRAVANAPTWSAVSLSIAAYTVSILAMMASLRHLNVGVVYAVWSAVSGQRSAVGVTGVAVAGVLLYGDRLGGRAVAAIALIILGVVVLVTSGSTRHG